MDCVIVLFFYVKQKTAYEMRVNDWSSDVCSSDRLRPYQVQDLAFHIANPKSLNLSDPGTGKTPNVCVLAYYHWAKHGRKTIWAMPKSLMEKNKDEFGLFTPFEPDDIAILESDFAPLTRGWTGPTFIRQKRVRSMRVRKIGRASCRESVCQSV